MALLNLTTLLMNLGDRLELAFFGLMVDKNGEMVRKTIKKEAKQYSKATQIQERQEIWEKIDSKKNFGIAARGLALAMDLLMHPSIITKGKVMEWFFDDFLHL